MMVKAGLGMIARIHDSGFVACLRLLKLPAVPAIWQSVFFIRLRIPTAAFWCSESVWNRQQHRKRRTLFHRDTRPTSPVAGMAVSRGLCVVGGAEPDPAAVRHRGAQVAGRGDRRHPAGA